MTQLNKEGREKLMRRSPCGYYQAGELDDVRVDEGEEEPAMVTVYCLAGVASLNLVSSGSKST
jgi:hypothetical protein